METRAPGVNRITLLGRPGCHLCDDARAVIERVAGDLGVGWEERDITASPQDMREYWDKIPVTLVDGVQVDFWRVSEARLRAALGASPAGRPDENPAEAVRSALCETMHKGVRWIDIPWNDVG